MKRKVAIIDLGSNSVRMLIMRIYRDGSYKMIDQAKEMVRLSEKMGNDRTLKQQPIRRTLYALKLFKKLAEAHQVDEVFAVATAAVRNAVNQKKFLDKAKEETGFDFKVISGEKEAYYDYLAVVNTIQIENFILMDIGGASTEIAYVENRRLKQAVSLPFGAVILAERFFSSDPISTKELGSLEEFIIKNLETIDWLKDLKGFPLIGLGGSVRVLAKMDKRAKKFPLDGLHNYRLNIEEVVKLCTLATKSNLKERSAIPGINKERADIIPAGLVFVKKIMEYLNTKELIISGNGLREGVFFDNYLSSDDQENGIVSDVLTHSVFNILKNYEMNLGHCLHVEKLALSLFDQTKELHGLGAEHRKLLSVGALLHDIGLYINYYNHNKHGFYLVLNSRISGLTNEEVLMCAFIVGMHVNQDLKFDWKKYNILIDKNEYKVVKILSLLVKIAEQLDRSEYGSVNDIICEISSDSVYIKLITNNHPELEVAEALKSQKLFKKLFGRNLNITSPPTLG